MRVIYENYPSFQIICIFYLRVVFLDLFWPLGMTKRLSTTSVVVLSFFQSTMEYVSMKENFLSQLLSPCSQLSHCLHYQASQKLIFGWSLFLISTLLQEKVYLSYAQSSLLSKDLMLHRFVQWPSYGWHFDYAFLF